MSARRSSSSGPRYPRSARLGETLREVIAEELVRIDDERLAFVTVTAIDVDNEMNRAIVYFDSLDGEDGDATIREVARGAPPADPGVDQPPDAGEEDADPRLPARRRDPRGRADRGHHPRRSHRPSGPTPSRWRVGARRPSTVWRSSTSRPGVTSHDVVGMLRRRLGERRIGHAGTLDPSATGVLVVGVGNVTRLMRFVGDGTKRYTGEVVLGVETDSLDADGAVVATHDMTGTTVDDARRVVAAHLVGAIEQVPPMVSAIQVDGRRLHELAREGIEVERAPRPVTVERFDVAATDDPAVLAIEVDVLGRHVRPHARGRPRPPPRRRCPPAQPAPHRRRALHARRGRASRRVPRCSTRWKRCGACAVIGVDADDRRARRQRSGAAGARRARAVGGRRARRPPARRLRTVRRRRGQAVVVLPRRLTASGGPIRVRGAVGVRREGLVGMAYSDALRHVARLDAGRRPFGSGRRRWRGCSVAGRAGHHRCRSAALAGRAHRRHDRRLRRRAPRSPGRHRRRPSPRRARGRPLGRAHVRPPPGDDRAPRVGAAAAHLARAAPRAARRDRCRRHRRRHVRRRPVQGAARRVHPARARQGARREGRRRRRGLPLRQPPRGQRQAARGARAHRRLRGRPDPPRAARRRHRRADQQHGDPPRPRRRRGRAGGAHARSPARGARHRRRRRPARAAARVPDRQRRGAQLDGPARPTASTPAGTSAPTAASTRAPSTSGAARRSTSTPTTRCSRPTSSTSPATSTARRRRSASSTSCAASASSTASTRSRRS